MDFESLAAKKVDKVSFFYEVTGLNNVARDQLGIVRNAIARLTEHDPTYEYLTLEAFRELLETKPSAGMQCYWREILQRVHFAASVSLFRSFAWFEGMIVAVLYENLLSFSAALRGLVESATDSFYALSGVPERLQAVSPNLPTILNGTFDRVITDGELEDRLIHFSHARKLDKGESVPDSHRAQSVRTYLDFFDQNSTVPVSGLYATLCQITHPAHLSVLAFAKNVGDGISNELGYPAIISLAEKNKKAIAELVRHIGAYPLWCLAILDGFPYEPTRTPGLFHHGDNVAP